MIKIFNKNEDWCEKVNFVDDNNLLVGYDLTSNCCEHFDWFISNKIIRDKIREQDKKDFDLSAYCFDKEFFNKPTLTEDEWGCNELDCGNLAVFKMVGKAKLDLYLHLYNAHNGYYSHGFKFSSGKEVIQEGYL